MGYRTGMTSYALFICCKADLAMLGLQIGIIPRSTKPSTYRPLTYCPPFRSTSCPVTTISVSLL
jgi:hypothetical protein